MVSVYFDLRMPCCINHHTTVFLNVPLTMSIFNIIITLYILVVKHSHISSIISALHHSHKFLKISALYLPLAASALHDLQRRATTQLLSGSDSYHQ